MAKYCEGNRVLDFTAGVTPIGAATYLNESQDQLKAMLGPRWISVLRLGQANTDSAHARHPYPYFDIANQWWVLNDGANVCPETQLQIPLYAGQKITDLRLTLYHAGADAGGGAVGIYSRVTTPAAGMPARTAEVTDATAFNAGGAATWYTHTETGLSIVAANYTDYYVSLLSLPLQVCWCAGVDVKIQFGN